MLTDAGPSPRRSLARGTANESSPDELDQPVFNFDHMDFVKVAAP